MEAAKARTTGGNCRRWSSRICAYQVTRIRSICWWLRRTDLIYLSIFRYANETYPDLQLTFTSTHAGYDGGATYREYLGMKEGVWVKFSPKIYLPELMRGTLKWLFFLPPDVPILPWQELLQGRVCHLSFSGETLFQRLRGSEIFQSLRASHHPTQLFNWRKRRPDTSWRWAIRDSQTHLRFRRSACIA